MESKAIAKFQRVSPRKTRLVAKNVQGKGVEEAMNILRFTPNKPAGVLLNVLKSAVANASQLGGVNVDAMVIKEVIVNEGPTWKRFMPRAQGRATKIHKRTSHVTVILEEGIGYGSESSSVWLPAGVQQELAVPLVQQEGLPCLCV